MTSKIEQLFGYSREDHKKEIDNCFIYLESLNEYGTAFENALKIAKEHRNIINEKGCEFPTEHHARSTYLDALAEMLEFERPEDIEINFDGTVSKL